ncbi:MAG TPA: bifunctional DNA-formamidopyrimidine glycosylase/DNA-(apurinic or apyrimidinic site) lyase [Syntrophomonadaceae bacterium]|nr:bifunctional DNA-formamidopyrimidine glycosylase/DNA-(apurinic or apyrimidinic site) lyase [Syntrophomonadaceae bacterium]
MPELPEVETIKTSLQSNVGASIQKVELRREDIVRKSDFDIDELSGQIISSLERRAKFLDFTLSSGRHLVVHLGMSGRLYQVEACQPEEGLHMHLVLHLDNDRRLIYQDARRFGGVWLLDEPSGIFSGLGAEPLTAAFTPAYLEKQIKGRKIAIKSLLLDQKRISGIGNIYADEALFAAGIQPQRPAGSLHKTEIKALVRAIKKVLKQGITARGTTLRDFRDGYNQAGGFQDYLQVYGRAGEPCPGCGRPLEQKRIGGRSSHFCSCCQK